MPEPIQRRKLYQEVLERLMARIHQGNFRPGHNCLPNAT
jgi:DNA-binding FadR family transcriptional regulator